ncbi:MAG: oxygenase MpaB family protein [Acidimicrobiales bacterium]
MADPRVLLLAPTALVLQVAHPVVGAGVAEHSTFLRDPWGRLARTVDSISRFTFGDDATAAAEAERLRRVHRSIRGIDDRGRRYHALDPDAYAWVHLTLAQAGFDARRVLGAPLSTSEAERFYQEWRQVGLRLGVRDDRMPPSWAAFRCYVDHMASERLEANRAVHDVFAATHRPPSPAPWLPAPAWDPLAGRAGSLQFLLTVGTLPSPLRQTLGLTWTDRDERRLWAAAAGLRLALAAVSPPLRYLPRLTPLALRALVVLRGSSMIGS